MLDERKAAILRAVVEEYIDTAQPVGSAHVVRASDIHVSSATVRNDMAVLEQEGYLRQPHTSAGRIPTEKGYRFFVDQLGAPPSLRSSDAVQVRSFFEQAHGELEKMLTDTSRLLGDLTTYAGLVVGPGPTEATVRSVQLVGLTPTQAIAVVVLSNGNVEKHNLELDEPVGEERLGAATAHLAAQLTGRPRGSLGPVPATGDRLTDDLSARTLRSLAGGTDVEAGQVYLGGTSHVARAFDAIETVREVLGILEQQYVVVTLVRDVLDRGQQVAIGTETGMDTLADCALIVAPYEVDGETAGSIGVLGPSRMDYQQAMAAVAVVSRRLSRRLTEG